MELVVSELDKEPSIVEIALLEEISRVVLVDIFSAKYEKIKSAASDRDILLAEMVCRYLLLHSASWLDELLGRRIFWLIYDQNG